MKIDTAQSRATNCAAASRELAASLSIPELGAPDFVVVVYGTSFGAEDLRRAVTTDFGPAQVHGGTSCLGLMTNAGVDIADGTGMGAMAIWDAEGDYGSASAEIVDDATEAAREAARAALAVAGRPGEIPELVWLTVAPGQEEKVLAGVRDIVGAHTPIVGGSSADNDSSGQWSQFGPAQSHANGVVVSVLFPSSPVASVYQSGYTPTAQSGVVTRVEGRRVYEIDGQPAAETYRRWCGRRVPLADDEAISILSASTLWPLGRETRKVAGVPFHLLAHPSTVNPDGSMDMFADVHLGDTLWQMQGTGSSLVARAGRIAAQARQDVGGAASGALVIYCGGCMLAVRDRMDEVCAGVSEALQGAPWIGAFTFGEQGVPPGGESEHGNLMISCTVFAE
ncbi:FIST signal transduction protein [Aliishimia ponticola]|nr:FIST N-terminal domain-containing protein [Aliishimia ponticola]